MSGGMKVSFDIKKRKTNLSHCGANFDEEMMREETVAVTAAVAVAAAVAAVVVADMAEAMALTAVTIT